MLVYAFLVGFLASTLPTFFSGADLNKKFSWGIASFIGNALLAWGYWYFLLPVATGPMGGFLNLWGVVVVNGAAGLLFWMVSDMSSSYGDSDNHHMFGVLGSSTIFVVMIIVLIFNGLGGWVNRDRDQFAYANITIKPISEMPANDNDPKPILSEGNAKTAFSSALPQATSTGRAIVGRYQLGDVVKQEIQGHIYWLGMLKYNSSWSGAFDDSVKTVPGYMIVNAEDPKSKASFVEYDINYFDGAFFDHDIYRHLYQNGFSDYKLIDPTIEKSDEDGKLYVTVGLAKYNFSVFSIKVEKVAIVDVTTGAVVNVCVLGECPKWVDRQVDDDFASQNVGWFGKFMKDDWWNPTGRDTFKADDKPVFVYSPENGRDFQFLMTSTSSGDNTSTGVVMYRTDEVRGVYYQVSGDPFPLGNQIVTKFQDNTKIKVGGYTVDQLLLLNISGHMSWLATMSSPNPPYGTQYQMTAYVLASSAQDVTSESVQFDKDPAVALEMYKSWLKSYFDKERGTIKGTVVEIGQYEKDGNTVFQLVIEDENGQIVSGKDPLSGEVKPVFFTVSVSKETREVTMTQKGDHVELKYIAQTFDEYQVTSLENSDRPSLLDSAKNALSGMMSFVQYGK